MAVDSSQVSPSNAERDAERGLPSRLEGFEPGSRVYGKHDPWHTLARMIAQQDQGDITALAEQLDSFLTFSAIFSAVITVFISQSSAALNPDDTKTAVDILRIISQQLGDPSVASAINVDKGPPQRSVFDIVINSLLYASLFCSLISSGMSLWVKQWLREHSLNTPGLARELARVRQQRYHAFKSWHITGMVALISILLQLSVHLFSAGCLMLAYEEDVILSLVLLVLSAVWWAATWATALCPTFSPQCPYKSPLARVIFWLAHYLRATLYKIFEHLPFARIVCRTSGLVDLEKGIHDATLEESERREMMMRGTDLELEALTYANHEFWGSDELKKANECFEEVEDKNKALGRIEELLAHRLKCRTKSDLLGSIKEARAALDDCTLHLIRIWRNIAKGMKDALKPPREELCRVFEEITGTEDDRARGSPSATRSPDHPQQPLGSEA